MTGVLRRHGKVMLGLISALAGAVLGAAISDVMTSDFRLYVVAVGLLALGIVGVLISQLAMADSRKVAETTMVDETKAIGRTVQMNHDAQASELRALSDRMLTRADHLAAQFGLRIDRMLVTETDSFMSPSDDPSARMILAVEREIRILDLVAEDGYWPDDAMNQQLLGDLFKQLIGVIEKSPTPISYRRIIQVAEPSQGLQNVRNGNLINHCREIFRIREVAKKHTLLRVARRRFPFKFVMIDRAHLILQLQEYGPNGSTLRLWGELQISDPSGRLIPIFEEIWDDIDNDDETRNAVPADLPLSATG